MEKLDASRARVMAKLDAPLEANGKVEGNYADSYADGVRMTKLDASLARVVTASSFRTVRIDADLARETHSQRRTKTRGVGGNYAESDNDNDVRMCTWKKDIPEPLRIAL